MTPRNMMRTIWPIMLLILLLMSAAVALPGIFTEQQSAHATLSALYNDNSMRAILYAENIDDGRPITITLTDENSTQYVLPGAKTSATTWEAIFPLHEERVTLIAEQYGNILAQLLTSKLEQQPSTTTPPSTGPTIIDVPPRSDKFLPTIKDAKGRSMQARTTLVKAGVLDIIPKDTPIKSIRFYGINTTEITSKKLGLDTPKLENVTKNENLERVVQSYAINPEDLNFTNASVTLTAKGSRLYKCAEWNFATETCEGTWEYHMALTPGQEYNLTITPKDPAFGETVVMAMEWGLLTDMNDSWRAVNLSYTYVDPIIVATPHYTTAGVPTVTRITNITSDNFTIRLQDTGGGTATTRNVSYLVMETGNWTLPGGNSVEAVKYTSTTTDNDADWTPDSKTYLASYTQPVIVGQVMSYNDTEWSVFWASDGTQTGDPTSAAIATAKHVGQDPSTTRTDEVIGYIVFEEGHGNLSGIEYDAALTTNSIRGITNSPPYNVAYNSGFSTTPQIAIASTAGMNGGNGGWPVTYGARTTAQIGMAYDEYDSGERSHTTEPSALVTFATAGSYLANEAPVITNATFNETQIEPTEEILFNVTVTDAQGFGSVAWVNATFRYPNGTLTNVSLSQVAIGQTANSGDQETGITTVEAIEKAIKGETGILTSVSTWTTLTFNNTYIDPVVFAFTRNQSDINSTAEQALAIVTNVTTTEARIAIIAPDSTFTTDDVGYVVVEKGSYNISGAELQVGTWSYTGTSFVTKTFNTPFSTTPTVYIQLQNQSNDWYTGRYDDATLGTTSIDIQYEDASDAFSGTYTVAYLAMEQGTNTTLYEGDIEVSVDEDPGAANWRALSFTNTHAAPVFMGVVSDAGGDPTKLGTGSLTTSGVNIRTTEETFSDAEQNHATNDVLWIAFNSSNYLEDDNSTLDNDATKMGATYEDVDNTVLEHLSSIEVEVNITNYNNSGSVANSNANPSIQVEAFTSTGWQSLGEKPLTGTGMLTWTTYDNNVLTSWKDTELRDVRVVLNKLDYNDSANKDSVSWNNVTITIEGGDKTSTWRTLWQDTTQIGTYNITQIVAYDYINTTTEAYTNLSFNVTDTIPPTFTYLVNVTFGLGQNVSVDYDATDYSDISDWDVNDTTRFSINSTGYLMNTSALAEGIYWLNISVNDTYNNTVWGTIYVNITTVPDITPPVFTPALTNITVNYAQSLYYDINATDDRGLLDVFWINDTTNFNIDASTGELTNNTLLAVDTYLLNVSVNDTSGNVNSSTLTIYVVDTIPPVITIINQTAEYGVPFAYKINATDESSIGAYWLTDTTSFTVNSSGVITNNTLLFRDGIYTMTVHVNDTYNNMANISFQVTVVDTAPPGTVTALQNTSAGKNWILWNWTNPTDSDLDHVEIWIDGTFSMNTTDESLNKTALMTNTNYTISIRTIDKDGNINMTWQNNTATTLPNDVPIITVNSPYNNSAGLEQWRTLNFTVNDTEETMLCITIYGDNTSSPSNEHVIYQNCSYNANNTQTYNWTAPVMSDTATAEALWHFDNNSLYGETDTLVNDFTSGTAYDLTCSGATCPDFIENSGKFGGAFDYDPTSTEQWMMTEQFFNDAFSQRSYQLWFKADSTTGTRYIYEEGGNTNGLAFKIESGTLQAATRTSNTQYTASTAFTDTSSWHFLVVRYDNGNLSMYLDNVLVDSTNTSASYTTISAHTDEAGLGGPNGGGAFGTETGTFDGLIDEFRITTSALSQVEIDELYVLQENNAYYWTINASDNYEYLLSPNNFLINDTVTDIAILDSHIIFNPTTTIEGTNTTIFATINNTGNDVVQSILIRFNDTTLGTTIGNRTITELLPGENETVNITYLASLGSHNITIYIDANNSITEDDENNNNASKWLNVSAWHTFYGSMFEQTVLEGGTTTFYQWAVQDVTTGNIYAADSDATIDWNALQALTRNTTNNTASEDLGEADIALGLTSFNTITSKYGIDNSTPQTTTTFTTYGSIINNVPVMNSTTTSSFQTGILWDMNDDTGDGEYDGTESLIFMTTINPDAIGTYGTYDYELTIPSALQTTEGASDTTYFYVEIT